LDGSVVFEAGDGLSKNIVSPHAIIRL